jgi:membrane protein implicated in regulation of membrane protease activity
MKKLLAVFALCAAAGMAADWTGYIIDKTCSSKKEMWGDEACAKRCLARGDVAVLVTEDGTIYSVANQDKVKESAGKKVTITGRIDGNTITVETLVPSKN